jgi:hypothetical protein
LEEDTPEGKQLLEGLNLRSLFEREDWFETGTEAGVREEERQESGGRDSGGEYSDEEDLYG